jgi:hypothetical protein
MLIMSDTVVSPLSLVVGAETINTMVVAHLQQNAIAPVEGLIFYGSVVIKGMNRFVVLHEPSDVLYYDEFPDYTPTPYYKGEQVELRRYRS